MILFTSKPRGFCSGVIRADRTLSKLIKDYSKKERIYVRKEIVHNRFVVDSFTQRGIVFVDELDEIPNNSITVFSAHGVSPEVREKSKTKGLRVVDATCPFVEITHKKAIRYSSQGFHIVFVGHKKHEEAIGTTGESIRIQKRLRMEGKECGNTFIVSNVDEANTIIIDGNKEIACISQTTLNVDEAQKVYDVLKERFSQRLIFPKNSEICYATKNRQDALKNMIKVSGCDPVFIIGSKNSSNSKRLVEVAKTEGINSYLIDSYKDIDKEMVGDSLSVGLSSGASAPEELFNDVVSYFKKNYGATVRDISFTEENIHFGLPKINF